MDTSELIIRPTPSNRDIMIVGSAAGITAGIAMAMCAALTSVWHGVGLLSSFEMVGATFTGATTVPAGLGSAFYGLLLHAVTAAGLGILFTAFLPFAATTRFATGAGLGFGAAVLIAMTFVVTPIVNPALRDGLNAIPKSWVIQHLIFGATLGVVPSFWSWCLSESVRVRIVQPSRRALLVRRPQHPASAPVCELRAYDAGTHRAQARRDPRRSAQQGIAHVTAGRNVTRLNS